MTDQSKNPPTFPTRESIEWAVGRVQCMASSARINAGIYGVRLLKGHGYPNEVMSDAQDALALETVLDALEMVLDERNDAVRALLASDTLDPPSTPDKSLRMNNLTRAVPSKLPTSVHDASEPSACEGDGETMWAASCGARFYTMEDAEKHDRERHPRTQITDSMGLSGHLIVIPDRLSKGKD